MKKLLNQKLFFASQVVFLLVLMLILSGCTQSKTFDVTYYNGEEVLKVEKVEEGKCATDWTPSLEGYDFKGWYGTPTFTHSYDFSNPITENIGIFGMFVSNAVSEDTRSFYIVGSGTSPILLESNWGKVINDTMKLTKDSDKNEYTITLDLYAGDQFQFALNSSWDNQRGVGYLQEFTLNGEEIFKNPGSAYGNSSKRSNIEVKKSGNYTFTLTTYPDNDYYDTENSNYTESGKENFNMNDYDTITWVRNGDATEVVTSVTTYYIKGSGVTNWTDVYNDHTKMINNDNTHTLNIYLKAGEEFLFTSLVAVGDKVSTGTEYLRYSNLDETSKELFTNTASYNMVAKAAGKYTFSYVESSKVLSATYVEEELLAADYYLDGTFGEGNWSGYCFNESFKLVKEDGKDVYTIKNVQMKADSEFVIQAFKVGSTERGEWGTESYNGLGCYKYPNLKANDSFSSVSDTNTNIKVLKAGAYDVSYDSYSQIITVSEHVDEVVYDVYIKGGMNSWNFGFLSEWKLTRSEADGDIYEITLDFEEGWEVGLAVFNEGETTGYGTWVGLDKLGSDGDANEKFAVASGNLKCNTAGKYKVVYNSKTEKIDIYLAQ